MPPAWYIHLTSAQESALKHLYCRTDIADERSRGQMPLLLAQGHSADGIARVTFFDLDTVLIWFESYEADGLTGLQDRPRSGRLPKMTRSSLDDQQQAADQDLSSGGAPFLGLDMRRLCCNLAQKFHLPPAGETT